MKTPFAAPEVLNVAVNSSLACNNRDCKKKINSNPGSKIVKCINCNKSMLVKNCYVDITVNFTIEKEGKEYSVTAFPKVVSLFLEKDIFEFKTTQTLLLKSCCFWSTYISTCHKMENLSQSYRCTKWKTLTKWKTMALKTLPINNFLLINTFKTI